MHSAAAVLSAARAELARFPGVLEGLLGGLDAAGWRARPAPGEWAPAEVVCHLRDEEVEDFGARVKLLKVGQRARLTIFRDGTARDVTVNVAERPRLPYDLSDQE